MHLRENFDVNITPNSHLGGPIENAIKCVDFMPVRTVIAVWIFLKAAFRVYIFQTCQQIICLHANTAAAALGVWLTVSRLWSWQVFYEVICQSDFYVFRGFAKPTSGFFFYPIRLPIYLWFWCTIGPNHMFVISCCIKKKN